MEGELKVCHMRYQFAQYEFLIRSEPKTTCFPSKRSFRPNYLELLVYVVTMAAGLGCNLIGKNTREFGESGNRMA